MKTHTFTVDTLVRDKKAAALKEKGIDSVLRQLGDAEYGSYLKKKLQEEAREAAEATHEACVVSELMDVYDVLEIMLKELKVSEEEFHRLRAEKREQKGLYESKLCLCEVTLSEDNPNFHKYADHPDRYPPLASSEG